MTQYQDVQNAHDEYDWWPRDDPTDFDPTDCKIFGHILDVQELKVVIENEVCVLNQFVYLYF